jgi:DNA-binding MarR family transcriptional regulator
MSSTRSARDYPKSQGGAAIGARLRRLSERLDRDADRIYADLDIVFEQRWYGVLNQLTLLGPLSVGDLAEALGITHAAVSQTRAALAAQGLVLSSDDPNDARRRVLSLSAAGRRLVTRLTPIWNALNEAARELDREAGRVVDALERLERALDRASLPDRVRAKLGA